MSFYKNALANKELGRPARAIQGVFAHNVSVVQWIEFRIPVPTIGVRLPTGIHLKSLVSYF